MYLAFEMVGRQDDYRAFSYISSVIESFKSRTSIEGRVLGRYGGPRFRQKGIKVRYFRARQRAPHRRGFSIVVRTVITKLRKSAANYHWFSDLSPYHYEALQWMRTWSDPNAKAIFFAKDLDTGLQLVELVYLFAGIVPNGIVLVLLNDNGAEDTEKIRQLRHWGVSIYGDGSGYSMASFYKQNNIISLDFNSKTEMPLQARKAPTVDWPKVVEESSLSIRAPEKVLFVRPDWMKCGSATTFSKLIKLFRDRGAILVDVALQPYRERYTAALIENKLEAVRQDLNPAFHFNFRRSIFPLAAINLLAGIIRHWPRTVAAFMPVFYQQCAMPQKARDLFRSANFDYLYVNHYFTLPYARKLLGDRPLFLDTHDIQSLNFVSHDYHHSIKMVVAPFTECLRDELAIMDQADRITLVSNDEIQLVKKYRPDNDYFYYIPIPAPLVAVSEEESEPLAPSHRTSVRLLIVASRNPANDRSLSWFLASVWPDLVGKNVALDIVGGISESFANQEFDQVNFLGMVEDLSLAYRRCDVILLPITNGGGIAIKTLEAIQYGKPIVATRHALRGLPENVPGLLEGCLSEKEFIDDLATLVEDPAARLERAKVVRRIGKVLEDCCFDLLMHRELDAIGAYARLGKVSQEHDLRPKPTAATGSSKFTVPGSVALKPLRINRNDTRLEIEILAHIRAFYLGFKHYSLLRAFYHGSKHITIPQLASEESLRTDGDVAYVAEMMQREQPHDDDYQIFRIFQDPDSLILDLGANWGYSVGALGAVGARSHIVSVEAIPSHEPCLAEVKRLRQDGFNYFITGLSDHFGSLQFVTPVVNDIGLSALSSASENVSFEGLAKNVVDHINSWINDDKLYFRLCTSEAPVTTLDRMVQDHPDIFSHRSVVAIKVDVEGCETEVLRGGTKLLRSHRPLVMAEGGNRNHGVRELMASLDYCFAERQGKKLAIQDGIGALSNGFFLHPSRLQEYRSAGIL